MEMLLGFQENILRTVKNGFRRYLHEKINRDQRMIAIKGPRGAGKTTLMLQYFKYDLGLPETARILPQTIPYWKQQMTGISKVVNS